MPLPDKNNETEMQVLEWGSLAQAIEWIGFDLRPIRLEDLRRSTNPERHRVGDTPEYEGRFSLAKKHLEIKLMSGELIAYGIAATGEMPWQDALEAFPNAGPAREVDYLIPGKSTERVKIPAAAWKKVRISYAHSAALVDSKTNYIDIAIKTGELLAAFPTQGEAGMSAVKRRHNEVLKLLYVEGKKMSENRKYQPNQREFGNIIFEQLPILMKVKVRATTVEREIRSLLKQKKKHLNYTYFRDRYVHSAEFKNMKLPEWIAFGEK